MGEEAEERFVNDGTKNYASRSAADWNVYTRITYVVFIRTKQIMAIVHNCPWFYRPSLLVDTQMRAPCDEVCSSSNCPANMDMCV